jgi:indolepyruvate ferredoxin oxidoreductase
VAKLPPGVEVHHRDELDRIQREFREIKGTTAIIYDQTCATEKRRRRKRGTLVDPAVRVVINDLVCEGCGDCSVKSNCLSVEPLETEFGRKRVINQSTCNKDTSCLKGFCPSFVTVEGGQLKKKAKEKAVSPFELGELPEPRCRPSTALSASWWRASVAPVSSPSASCWGWRGISRARASSPRTPPGLAQKGGATWSHVLIGERAEDIRTTRVSMAAADLIIGCDPIVTAGKETVLRMRQGRTHVALNSHSTPTAAFVTNANWANPSDACAAEIVHAVGPAGVSAFNADVASTKLMGDSIYTNPMMLGYAWQKGLDPAGPRGTDARHRTQRRGRGQQQGRVRVGPPGGPRLGVGRKAADIGPGDRVQEARNAGRASSPGASSSSPPTRTAAYADSYKQLSRRCAWPRAHWARPR